MIKLKLEKIDSHLKEKLRNKEFRKHYELECAKGSLAQKIAEIRQHENLNQAELAKKLHVSQQFISQIETAEENNLTLDTLLKIASSLGRSVKISFPKISNKDSVLTVS